MEIFSGMGMHRQHPLRLGVIKVAFAVPGFLPAGNYCPGGEVLGQHRKDRLLNNSITVLGWSH